MKVVLLKDVPKVGKKFDVREVSDGYARNFLLRNGLAEIATPKSLKVAEDVKKKIVAEKDMKEAEVDAGLARLSKVRIVLKGRANDEGILFAGVNAEELSRAIKDQAGLIISPEYIDLDKPVKTVGEVVVVVSVGSKKSSFKLSVEKE